MDVESTDAELAEFAADTIRWTAYLQAWLDGWKDAGGDTNAPDLVARARAAYTTPRLVRSRRA